MSYFGGSVGVGVGSTTFTSSFLSPPIGVSSLWSFLAGGGLLLVFFGPVAFPSLFLAAATTFCFVSAFFCDAFASLEANVSFSFETCSDWAFLAFSAPALALAAASAAFFCFSSSSFFLFSAAFLSLSSFVFFSFVFVFLAVNRAGALPVAFLSPDTSTFSPFFGDEFFFF